MAAEEAPKQVEEQYHKEINPDAPNAAIAFNDKPPDVKMSQLEQLMGGGTNPTEVRYVLLMAILIALNNGFINGVCLSAMLSQGPFDLRNPNKAMVSGTAGYVTNTATQLIIYLLPDTDAAGKEAAMETYIWNLSMFMCYMAGSFIPGFLSPRAKPYSFDPFFGPSFIIGGSMLLASSLLTIYQQEANGLYGTEPIFYLAIAANGVQNGIASIYSANLIRCTLTGAITDIGLVFGQMLRGNFVKVARAIVLAIIVISFWAGGLVAFPVIRTLGEYSLVVNACLFYFVGVLCIVYLMVSMKLSFAQALTGNWDWKTVLKKIQPSGTEEDMMALFDKLDHDGGGTLDMYELEKGLAGQVSHDEMKALLNAADSDNSGDIDKQEWADLVKELFSKEG
mmetsp:Transcript_12248/g.14028  ORF Transcript_12248/g.14028 Transcript_12248/m.14028 type:complete len:394 (-) Transcript_12248:340-1521(-)|eukprot:CAMPEP_0170825498 /NCGR_PEP_ID=MMETSP0733-20121128/45971_1 /TAXON_ID=186038 /ORGANISM="Fragilariopsis kerguelensis, Strain L26-C5" /LENGTH=393 /DNA_ID=CAMNT_0011189021 /DNA_START=66 /DNA_END=1247 /DNA_ORIENTATION=-